MPRLANLTTVLDTEQRIAPTHTVLIDKLGGSVDGIWTEGHYATWRKAQGGTLDGWTRETAVSDLDPTTVASFKKLVAEAESDFTATMLLARYMPEAQAHVEAGVDDLAILVRRLAQTGNNCRFTSLEVSRKGFISTSLSSPFTRRTRCSATSTSPKIREGTALRPEQRARHQYRPAPRGRCLRGDG